MTGGRTGERASLMSRQIHPVAAGQGGNSTAVRHYNERRLLTVLRRLGEASRPDLARQLNLTQNTVGQIVQSLEQQGLITSTGRRMGQRGQPATMLRLDSAGAYAIGIKLGRRSIDALLIDFTGTVLKSRRFERLDPEPTEAVQLALRGVRELRRALAPSRRDRLVGVGLALPVTFQPCLSEAELPTETLQAWQSFDFAAELRSLLDVPVFGESNGTAVALAELFCGHGRELDDFLCVYLNSSISAGIVLGGDTRRGANGRAGSMQAIPVPPAPQAPPGAETVDPPPGAETVDPPPGAGATDPPPGVEAVDPPPGVEAANPTSLFRRASGSALIRHLRAHGVDVARAGDLHAVMRSHEALVSEWLRDCAEALVVPLFTTASLLDVQAIILDGNLPRPLIEALLERLTILLGGMPAPPVELRLGSIGNQAAALGAAFLPLHSRHGQASAAATTVPAE